MSVSITCVGSLKPSCRLYSCISNTCQKSAELSQVVNVNVLPANSDLHYFDFDLHYFCFVGTESKSNFPRYRFQVCNNDLQVPLVPVVSKVEIS